MPVADGPDWSRGITLVQVGSGPVTTTDVPDWSDPIAVLASGAPTADYPDWTKATVVTAGSLPGGTPPLPNPSAWWDATQVPAQADDTPLSVWPDASGNSHPVVSDGAVRPDYIVAGIAGKPTVRWGLVGAHMGLVGALVVPQPLTFVVVAQYAGAGVGSFLFGFGGTDPFFGINGAATAWQLGAGGTPANVGSPDTALHMFVVAFNGASSSLTIDATTTGGLSVGGDGLLGYGLMLGAFSPSAPSPFSFNGDMGEALVYPSALSAGQIATCRSYCQAKWGTP